MTVSSSESRSPDPPDRTHLSAHTSTPDWPSLPRPVTRSSASRSETDRDRRGVRPLGGRTALAGAVLKIDPFDQPNVEEAKANTRGGHRRLRGWKWSRRGRCGPSVVADEAALAARPQAHLVKLAPNGYASIQAYVAQTPDRDAALKPHPHASPGRDPPRHDVGYGPRFLHSTASCTRAGAPIGWLPPARLRAPSDLEIPGQSYTFGQLIDAQAIGDARTLVDHNLPDPADRSGTGPGRQSGRPRAGSRHGSRGGMSIWNSAQSERFGS